MKTRVLAGHAFQLQTGRRYLATRPMAQRGMRTFDLSITDMTDGYRLDARPVIVIRGLSYDAANQVLSAFNNGSISFAGRVW